jgi:hypothetical protein
MEQEGNVSVVDDEKQESGAEDAVNVKKSPEELEAEAEAIQEAEDAEFMKDFDGLTVDELISSGFSSYRVDIHEKFQVRLRTLRQVESIDVDKRSVEYNGSNAYFLNSIIADLLTYAIMEINGAQKPLSDSDIGTEEFEASFQKKRKQIMSLSDVIIGAIHDEWKRLQKASIILVKGGSNGPLARRLLGQGLT